jgi:hypothetical protein
MTTRRTALALAALGLAVVFAGGCGGSGGGGGDGGSGPGMPVGTLAPDFLLPDVNPSSATTGTDVSPRDHLGGVSAWYFAHAT